MWDEGRGPVPRTSRLRCVSGGAGLATRGRHVFDVVPNGGAGVSRSTQRGGVRGRKGGGGTFLMSWFKVRFRRLPGFVSWESGRPGCRLWHSSALSAVGLAVLRHVSVVPVCRERRQAGAPSSQRHPGKCGAGRARPQEGAGFELEFRGRVVLLAGPELHFRHKRRTPIPGRIKDLVQVPVGGPRSGSAWQALGLWSGRGRMWVLESGAFPGP